MNVSVRKSLALGWESCESFAVSTYRLSWEEFLEFHDDRLPKPSITSLVVTIFLAIAVGVFGIALTYAVDPGSKFIASSSAFLGMAKAAMTHKTNSRKISISLLD